MNLDKKYLPTLDSLRFIAAALVLFGHIDLIVVGNGHRSSNYNFFPFAFQDKAVVFFFVLSGFLITYLLLKEKEVKQINIKAFYLKRIFRIWPVYFIVVISAYGYFNCCAAPIFRYEHYIAPLPPLKIWDIILLCLISPNVVLTHLPVLGCATHTWSIGVEEQFYAIWPWLARKKNFIVYILGIILIVYILSKGVLGAIAYLPGVPLPIRSILISIDTFFTFMYSFKIDMMAIGAAGAYLVIKKQVAILSIIFSKPFQIILYVVTCLLLIFPSVGEYHFHGVLFLLIILNVSFNDASLFNLDNPVTNYLGKISYGIYMYHYVLLMPAIKICLYFFHLKMSLFTELLMCMLCLLMAIAVSAISYHLVELNFLKLKSRILGKKDRSAHTP